MNPIIVVLLGTVTVIGCILVLRLHAFLALIAGALLVASLTSSEQLAAHAVRKEMGPKEMHAFLLDSAGARVAREFGAACSRIGILIALASIVGKCMMESGAADRVVRSIASALGARRAPLAFFISGYVLSIPVFFDTVFLLLSPLCKAMWMRTRRNYALYFLAVISGGSMSLSLVPPEPGPTAVAKELGVEVGRMMLMGGCVALVAACVGLTYAAWIDRRIQLPVRESPQSPLSELEAVTSMDESSLPPLWLSALPIVLPVLLIGGISALNMRFKAEQIAALADWQKSAIAGFRWLGDPNVALTISAGAAILLAATSRRQGAAPLKDAIRAALGDGGQILLIIAAGGAFGGALQQTGIGQVIESAVADKRHFVLPIAFLVTAFVRGAQGSATVAMITVAGMFAGLATPEKLGFHPVYLALAIGAGSKPFAWMNDSGFWVIGKMTGMTESETLKTFSVQIAIEGVAAFLTVMVLSRLLPMV